MTETMALRARGLCVTAAKTPILHQVDVAIAQGCWTAIVGPNGAGKSTLLRALAGVQPSSGELELLGRPLHAWPARQRAQQLAWLGQNEAVVADLLSYEVVMLGRLPHQGWLAAPSAHDHAVVQEALRRAHAWQWHQRPLAQLSGGERQRVLLARALAVEARVLLMDEPLANLDPPQQSAWMQTVRALSAEGVAVVSVLHELGIALQSEQLIVMQRGRVLHQGATSDSATHAALEAVFEQRIRVRQVDGRWWALPV